jgi:integrase
MAHVNQDDDQAKASSRRHRGHGEGSILERENGKFQAQILVSGRRLSRTCATKKDAQKWIRETLEKADQGMLAIDGRKVAAEAFLDQWLAATKPSIKPKTYQQYEGIIRRHLKPKLGKLKLAGLKPHQLQGLYAEKLEAGLSARTVRLVYVVMRHALDDAVRWNLVPRNVAVATTPPRPSRKEMAVWTPEQARAFLKGVAGERQEAVYHVAVSCGLRVGELLGLRWDDVNLDTGRLQVRRTIQRLGKGIGLVVGEPKSEKGRRQVAIPAPAVESLRRWRVRQLEERLFAGGRWHDEGYIFATRIGTPYEPRNLLDDFVRDSARLGLPRIRLHDLRHTCATMLLTQGVPPKVVQEMLGHSQIAMTMDIYSHVLPSMQEAAALAMERVLAGA